MAMKFLNTVQVDTDVLYVDTANDRVGIGTDNPDTALHVAGSSTLATQSTVLKIENTADQGSSQDIHIYNQYDRDIGIKFETLGGTNYIWQDSNSDDALIISTGGNNRANDAALILEQDQDVIVPNGRLGIGATNPGTKLEVAGITTIKSPKAYGSEEAVLRIGVTSSGTNYSDGTFHNIVFGNESVANSHLGEIQVVQGDASASTASDMRFFTNSGGGNTATNEAMRITSVGNVGIGTINPVADLQVSSTKDGMTNGVNTNQLKLSHNASVVGMGSSVAFGVSGNNNFTGAKIVHERTASNSVGDLTFWTRGTAGTSTDYDLTVERMRIDSAGAIKFNAYSAGTLVSDASGNITATTTPPGTGVFVPLAGGSSTGQAMTGTLYGPGATFSVSGNNSSNLQVGDGSFRMEMGRSSIQARVVGASGAASNLNLNPNGGDVIFSGSGNVGIGTTDPTADLHIQGSSATDLPILRVGGFGNSGSKLELAETLTSGDMTYGYSFFNDGNSSNTLVIKAHNNSTTGITAMTIDRGNALTTFGPVPVVGTRTAGDNTTRAASTAFVTSAITAAAPTVNNGTLTMTTSTGLDGGATFTANQSGNSAFAVSLDLSELADMTQTMIGSDEFIVLDNSAERRKAASEIGLSIFNNDAGFTTNTGDITAVVAGTGLTGGGTSGSVTLNVAGGTYTPYNDIRSLGVRAFTNGTNPNITTAQVMAEIDTDGGFDSYSSVFKTSWSYAGNYNLTDAGDFTETAGSSWITWTDNSSDTTRGNITALAIAPNTGGSAGGVFIYNDQGSSYSPGWRQVWTSMTDGAGSGLDADLLDGQEGSYYAPASGGNYWPTSGSWWGSNMPGSRARGTADDGGEIVVIKNNPSNGRSSILVDGQFYAGENGGFYSLYSGNNYNNKVGFYGNSSGDFYITTTNVKANGNTVWHAGNDGAGSGLDADTVDGLHASSLVSGGSNRKSTQVTSFAGSNEVTGAYYGNNVSGAPTTDWINYINTVGNSWANSNNYAMQLTHAFHSDSLWVSRTTNGTNSTARLIIDSGNISTQTVANATNCLPLSGGAMTGNIQMNNQIFATAGNYGRGVFGLYNASKYQHVWSMGTAYKLADNGASTGTGGNLYGLAWSYNPGHGGAGNNAQSKAGLDHQLLLMMNGTTKFAAGNGMWTSGDATIGGEVYIPNKIIHTGDSDTYTQFHAANQWRVVTGGNEMLEVTTNNVIVTSNAILEGKVFINATASIPSRTEEFQVTGRQIITNTGTDGPSLDLGYNSSGSVRLQLGRGRTADGLAYMDFNGEVMSAGSYGFRIIRNAGANAVTQLNQVGTGNLQINAANGADTVFTNTNVGIGTTDPQGLLEVQGAAPYIYITDTTETDSGIIFRDLQAGMSQAAAIKFNSSNNKLQFYNNDAAAVRMTFDTAGNVGIGTTTPGAKLEVGGAGAVLRVGPRYTSGGDRDFVDIIAHGTDSKILSNNERFYIENNLGDIIINPSGNVGIGITSPSAPLHITGPAPVATQPLLKLERSSPVVDYLDTSSSGYFLLKERYKNVSGTIIGSREVQQNPGGSGLYYNFDNGASGGSQHNQKQNSFHWKINSNSEKLTLGTNGYLGVNDTSPSYQLDVNGSGRFTSTVTATNFILSSDERLKENIEKVCDNRVEVDWKTFELKTEKGQKRYGVIAQELEKTNPEFVREDSQGFKSVAYIDLLIAKIAELEARLEKLEK